MGWNLEGAIKPSDKAYIRELEPRIAELENIKKRKSKNERDFGFLFPAPKKGERAWDF